MSRSGYYNYFSKRSTQKRVVKAKADEIVKVYQFRGRQKGAHQTRRILVNQYKTTYNLKHIRLIVKKFEIICPIRKVNSVRIMAKAMKEHRICPNVLQRNFKPSEAGKLLLTFTY